jgi:hypothetical protein
VLAWTIDRMVLDTSWSLSMSSRGRPWCIAGMLTAARTTSGRARMTCAPDL